MADEEISALLGRVVLRDRDAFGRLYRQTSPKLFGVCLRILKDRSEAEEALQEIYVKVWQRADRFAPGQASPMSWLTAIARNHAIDLIRARNPSQTRLTRPMIWLILLQIRNDRRQFGRKAGGSTLAWRSSRRIAPRRCAEPMSKD